MYQFSHISQSLKTTKPFQLVHSDLWGPAHITSTAGYRYYIHFVDDFTCFTWIYPLTLKFECTQIVKQFITMIKC